MSDRRTPTRGKGLFREEWYSICSVHYRYQKTCNNCKAGDWHNVVSVWFGQQVFEYMPNVWRWWANR